MRTKKTFKEVYDHARSHAAHAEAKRVTNALLAHTAKSESANQVHTQQEDEAAAYQLSAAKAHTPPRTCYCCGKDHNKGHAIRVV